MINLIHVLNQFFAGIGGEEKADIPIGVREEAIGAARGLQQQLGHHGRVIATLYFGDNYFHQNPNQALASALREVRRLQPQVIVAGPAFGAGRYGLACVELCQAFAETLSIPCVTAMHPENPAVATYRDYHNSNVYLLPTADTAAGMTAALAALGQFACRLGNEENIGSARDGGYISRGIRQPALTDRPGVDRAIDMLLAKCRNEPHVTELQMEAWDQTTPAPAISDLKNATIALITTSGVVPWGNPDQSKTFRNTYWRKYNIAGARTLDPGRWEAVHGGYDVSYMNQNPHYGVPLDALRGAEDQRAIAKLYPFYYVIPGNQGAPSVIRQIGREIANDLRKEGVHGSLLVST
jgi:glycine reductase